VRAHYVSDVIKGARNAVKRKNAIRMSVRLSDCLSVRLSHTSHTQTVQDISQYTSCHTI